MPELPEVETIARDLRKSVRGQRIEKIEICDARVVRHPRPEDFVRDLAGQTLTAFSRRGKMILAALMPSRKFLIIQLMMTGQLVYGKELARTSATKLIFLLSNQYRLHYNDYRLFGRLQIVDDLKKVSYLQTIGPEPLGPHFTLSWLNHELKKKTAPIKSLLMNQNFVAGIGNIYASEILFHCHIHPQRPAKSLRKGEVEGLHQATIDVLKEAVKLRGTSMNTYRDGRGRKGRFYRQIRVYGREKENCFLCKAPLQKVVLSGRSTFYCKDCQH